MREVFTKEKKHFCFKCESPCNTKLSSICFPSKNHLLYIVFSQAPPVSTMTHFSVVFNCGLTSDINSMLIFTIIQGTMLSWYKSFLIDFNAAKQLSSFNIWLQKFPQCWVSFDSLTPEGYWRPGSKSPWLMMNLTKFTWSCLCYPTIGPKLVQGTTLMHANSWLQN